MFSNMETYRFGGGKKKILKVDDLRGIPIAIGIGKLF
jgi:hypothetical protein